MAQSILAAGNTEGPVSPMREPPSSLPVFTLEEIAKHDGRQDGGKGDILLGLLGTVYDVSTGSTFYGPGGPYEKFAGKDATSGLASFNLGAKDGSSDYSALSERHFQGAKRWKKLFDEKYKVVGRLEKYTPWTPQATNTDMNGSTITMSSWASEKPRSKFPSRLCRLL